MGNSIEQTKIEEEETTTSDATPVKKSLITKLVIFGIVIALALVLMGFFSGQGGPSPKETVDVTATPSVSAQVEDVVEVEVLTENLDTPWGIAVLPDGDMLVTERPGRVRLVSKNGDLQFSPVVVISNVKEVGEAGLLGIALHPDFEGNQYVYLYYSYGVQVNRLRNDTVNRVVRMTLENNRLVDEKIIVDQIPGADFHNGGRIAFGPDKYLYITTGDAQDETFSQDLNSLAGKILRVTDEGKPAPENPFDNLVYSFGHRNPQGIAWDPFGNLWETEHGRSNPTGFDEVNRIGRGGNYGWPNFEGDESGEGAVAPMRQSGETVTWAPGGAVFLPEVKEDARLYMFFGGLKGEALYEVVIRDGKITDFKEHLKGEYGRIRDVAVGPDRMLYITTSNQDGRGNPVSGDDRIIRVNPQKLR